MKIVTCSSMLRIHICELAMRRGEFEFVVTTGRLEQRCRGEPGLVVTTERLGEMRCRGELEYVVTTERLEA